MLKLPSSVQVCSVCNGQGKYEQTYIVGCGYGTYRSMGPCDWCNSTGFVYKGGDTVPASVVNQIRIMNQISDESA